MYNLTSSIDALRDAETIVASKLLDENERLALLRELVASIHETIAPSHAVTIRNAVLRRLPAPKQGRTSEGKQDAPEVAEGSPEAPEGEAEGIEEQAKDDTGVPARIARNPDAEARPAAKAKGRKAR